MTNLVLVIKFTPLKLVLLQDWYCYFEFLNNPTCLGAFVWCL